MTRSLFLLCLVLSCTAFVTRHHAADAWKFRFPGRNTRANAAADDIMCEAAASPFLSELQQKASSTDYEDLILAALKKIQVPQPLVDFWGKFTELLFYEPPVGVVTIIVVARLIWSGRIFRVYKENEQLSAEGVLQQSESKQKKRRVRPSRPFYLEKDDFSYDSYGGVERIRRKLCWAALHGIHHQTSDDNNDDNTVVPLALEALQATHTPGSPRAVFIEDVITPLAQLETSLTAKNGTSTSGRSPWSWPPNTDADLVVQTSAKAAEIRALDALLRMTRDRLVVTSSRLARTVRHWKRRVRMQRALKRWVSGILHKTREGDQLVLSMVQASYETEIARLGAIQRVLMKRPEDMSEKELLSVLSKSQDVGTDRKKMPEPLQVPKRGGSSKSEGRFRLSLPMASKYALRWNADGRGRLTLRVFDDFQSGSSQAALEALVQRKSDQQHWLSNAHAWTQDARSVLYDVLKESFETMDVGGDKQLSKDLAKVERWSSYNYSGLTGLDVEQSWTSALNLVESLDAHRRIGEGRTVRFDAGLGYYLTRLDIFGIPSSLVTIALAQLVHNRLLPYWPKFKAIALQLLSIAWTIFNKRFWQPFYGIVEGLISKKSSSLLDAFDVDNEETSLDNMLRDLGLGDGTPKARREAIQGAARAYEHEMDSGVLRSAIRGRLVRLLLVQVQQLKAGLLHALASIDVLVDANKLNLQILTAIPSVLLVIFGTRFFIRALFTVRSKDLRSLLDVHTEMLQYLDSMEKTLIMSGPSATSAPDAAANGRSNATTMLEPKQLGEYCLHMHSYLVLLDYSSPPFPFRVCESIQHSMNDLLAMQSTGDRLPSQVDMVHLIRKQHSELEKWI